MLKLHYFPEEEVQDIVNGDEEIHPVLFNFMNNILDVESKKDLVLLKRHPDWNEHPELMPEVCFPAQECRRLNFVRSIKDSMASLAEAVYEGFKFVSILEDDGTFSMYTNRKYFEQ